MRRSSAPLLGAAQPVALHWRIADARPFENAKRLWDIGAGRPLREVFLSAQGRKLLGHRHIDELVERYTLGLSHLASLVEQRRLKPKREVALPHDFSSCFTVSAGDRTSKAEGVSLNMLAITLLAQG